MRHRPQICSLVIVAISLLELGCQRGEDYDLDKTSPNGVYRVKVTIRSEGGKDTLKGYTDVCKYQFLKGPLTIYSYDWRETEIDQPTFRGTYPIIEWVDDNVLRMGRDRSDPFDDKLIVSNRTDEYLKYMAVGGTGETFWLFDVAPNSEVVLRSSPGFKPGLSPNNAIGYRGLTQSDKMFENTRQERKRESPADGPLTFQITINPVDLQ